jgi:RNA recognition motif-containing protein
MVQVITDATTARSKGYGFVRFASEVERDRALNEMNGHFLSNRPIRVSLATARKNALPGGTAIPQLPHPSDFDPTNTTLFIGGLSSQVSEDQLRAVFARFGDIIYVKIPQGKGCGFVQFVLRTSAERAMMSMNGQVLGNSAIRISWGRSSSRAANQLSANQMTGLASGFPAGGPPGNLGNFPGGPPFAGMPPDPMLFAAVAAGGYGNVPSTAGQFVPQSVPTSINNDFANINLNAMNMMANGMAGPPAGMEMLSVNQYGMPAYTPSPADSLAGTSPPPGLLNGNGVGVGGDSLHSGMGLNGISLPVMIPQPANQVLPTDASNPNSHPESVVEGPNARSSAGASPAKDGPPMMKEFDMGRVGALANTSSKPISNANAIMNTNTNGRTNSGSDGHSGIGKSSSGISEHAGKAVVTQYNPAGKSASSGTMPGAQLLASLLV